MNHSNTNEGSYQYWKQFFKNSNTMEEELKEPNHHDYKYQNWNKEWLWKSERSMYQYAEDYMAWREQERKKFMNANGLGERDMVNDNKPTDL